MNLDQIKDELEEKLINKWKNKQEIIIAYEPETLLNKRFVDISKVFQKLKKHGIIFIALTASGNIEKIKKRLNNKNILFDKISNKMVNYDLFIDQRSGIKETDETIRDLLYGIDYEIKLKKWDGIWKEFLKKQRVKLLTIGNIDYDFLNSLNVSGVSVWGNGSDMNVPTLYFKNKEKKYELKLKGAVTGYPKQFFRLDAYYLRDEEGRENIMMANRGESLFEIFDKFPWEELGKVYK